ncbi:pyridoxal phosphate-dependent aminotransferase [candidate division KSB1 bacterium]|nr:pyridoxal phosphate-dependent aminotransferase [candidate division KSB1 bacterium]
MIANRMESFNPFIVMEVLEHAQRLQQDGINVIHLEVGEPDFCTPVKIVNAGRAALDAGDTHYTHSLGVWELRESIARHYNLTYHVNISPEQVIVTSGTSPGMLLMFSALLNPGDEVICSNPGYACYPNFIQYVDANVCYVNVHESSGFALQPDDVRKQINSHTKAILINSPSNPTGQLLSSTTLSQLAELGALVISDEIYHGLVYGEQPHSILEFTDNAIVLNGFSKRFAMTGWRLGYLIVPSDLVRPIQKLQQNFFISANSFVQQAGIAALDDNHPELEIMRQTYDERRKYMVKRLRDIGFGITVEPKGAFYVFANARHLCSDSYQFAFDVLKNAHVAITPGIDFGSNGEGYIRFSYANSLENIQVGLDRLERYLKSQ